MTGEPAYELYIYRYKNHIYVFCKTSSGPRFASTKEPFTSANKALYIRKRALYILYIYRYKNHIYIDIHRKHTWVLQCATYVCITYLHTNVAGGLLTNHKCTRIRTIYIGTHSEPTRVLQSVMYLSITHSHTYFTGRLPTNQICTHTRTTQM